MEKTGCYLSDYYESHDERGRLLSKHGQVEYLTTMKYIKKYLKPEMRILEIGAGTGTYSIALAKQGYHVDAVELIKHNINVFKQSITANMDITVRQGNALDLGFFQGDSFDMVLLLGPMYHLYQKEEQTKALSEALRVAKIGGYLFTAYCNMDASIINHGFIRNNMKKLIENGLIETEQFLALSTPAEIFQLYRKENIDELMNKFDTNRLHYIAVDFISNHIPSVVDNMTDDEFNVYMKYHFYCCERPDMIGITHHILDVVQKNNNAIR